MSSKASEMILVPTDFSETCYKAIEFAADTARKQNFRITLLHVITSKSRAALRKEKKGLETVIGKLESIKKEIEKKYGIKVNYTAREGSIFDVISEVAAELHARLMILGTHGKKGLQYLFGSFAFKVISQSPVPVIVIQQSSPFPSYKKIVFPITVFTEPRQKVEYTVEMSRRMGYKVIIFKQFSEDAAEKSQLTIITSQIAQIFDQLQVPYEILTAEKGISYEKQLISLASTISADAVLMMTDSRIDHPDFNNSSWSERLIFNEAAIPVICINPVYLGEIYYGF
jgi:nucleotide-binding universal stress UspA family protein